MKNKQNITIATLLVSAVVLTAVLVGTYIGTGEKALADSPASAGDYTWTTGAFDKEFDLLYMIDIAKQQLVVYRSNRKTKSLELADKIDLVKAFR